MKRTVLNFFILFLKKTSYFDFIINCKSFKILLCCFRVTTKYLENKKKM